MQSEQSARRRRPLRPRQWPAAVGAAITPAPAWCRYWAVWHTVAARHSDPQSTSTPLRGRALGIETASQGRCCDWARCSSRPIHAARLAATAKVACLFASAKPLGSPAAHRLHGRQRRCSCAGLPRTICEDSSSSSEGAAWLRRCIRYLLPAGKPRHAMQARSLLRAAL